MTQGGGSADTTLKLQLLGLAFAGADLVFEIDAAGIVQFALGAAERVTGRPAEAVIGAPWRQIIDPSDHTVFESLLSGLQVGARQGPLRLHVSPRAADAAPLRATVSVLRLPQRPDHISCALIIGGDVSEAFVTPPDGLMDRDTFTNAAGVLLAEAKRAGLNLRLELVEMPGLEQTLSAMDAETAEATRRQIAATLRGQSHAGLGATEIAADRYALVRSATASSDGLAASLKAVTGDAVSPITTAMMFSADVPAQNLRAMRVALDRYILFGGAAAQASFSATVEQVMRDTARVKSAVAERRFALVYQPVVALRGETLHHFEALARFDGDASPADTIRLAENLDLIADFDLAVAATVAKVLVKAKPDVAVAVNISAVSLMRPGFIEAITALTADTPKLRQRLLLELTETHELLDLERANKILQALRRAGHQVCLDDFGAGAASLNYLRQLEVDIVKIDGRYIQTLDSQPRDAVVLKHMIALCTEFGLATIAEMIETKASSDLAMSLGVTYGQGWFLGKPTPEPDWTPAAPVGGASRRKGAVESWG
jgi:EAL domain-containing protein (putative c-di-GMP-specific phosphodiesterase class I)